MNEVYDYGRKNLAFMHVMVQSPYVTVFKRDVAMSALTYIANTGGLLGLCLGFSIVSGESKLIIGLVNDPKKITAGSSLNLILVVFHLQPSRPLIS